MPEITVTESQRERLETIRGDIEATYIDTYGHIRRTDVVQYLLDTYTPPEQQGDDVAYERIATADFGTLQAVATDVEGDALRVGREGLYPKSIEADVSRERLDQFFRPEEEYYRVAPRLRETIVFAEHDLLTDPPFSDLDLVSCRNLLIYLQPEMQRRALRRIHYGLRDRGHLFLGRSETVGRQDDLFSVIDQGHNLLRARVLSEKRVPAPPRSGTPGDPDETLLLSERGDLSGSEEAADVTPSEVAKLHYEALMQDVSGLLVDEDFNVVHLTDRASEHLAFRERAPNFNVLDLVPKELRPLVQTALYRAFEKGESSRYPRV